MGQAQMLDRAKLEKAYLSFRTLFNDALMKAPKFYETLAMKIDSNGPTEVYNWLGELPLMKKWVGDRELAKLRAYDWSIKNEPWANGIRVDRDDIRFDKLGMVRPRISGLARMAEAHKDKLLFDLLVGGFTQKCYDGQFFFDTDHQDAAETAQTNKATAVLAAAAYETAWEKMLSLTDTNGEPLQITPTHLIVGPKNRATALSILKDERLASGASNRNFGTAELVVSPRLVGAYANYWFLVDLSKADIKPLILQIVDDVQFVAQDKPDDENAFMRREYRYGADWMGNAGYGLWQLAYGSDGTV